MHRKGEVSTFFVYAASVILIAFVSYLVIKFAVGFTKDTKSAVNLVFFDEFNDGLDKAKSSYGSIFTKNIRAPLECKEICLVMDYSSCPHELDKLKGSRATVILLGKDVILSAKKVDGFYVPGGCVCRNVSKSYVTLRFENNRNKVFVSIVS